MFGGNQPQGFTIVETLIFLTVSALIFLSVLGLVSGQQNKTQYSQGIHEVFSQIQALSNDVQNGSYTSSNNFTCLAGSSGAPTINANPSSQGTNVGCTFVGRVLQFVPTNQPGPSNNQQYNVLTLVGRQFTPNDPSDPSSLVSNLTDASTVPLVLNDGTNPEPVNLPSGVKVDSVSYKNSGVTYYTGIVGFFSSFPSSNGTDGYNSGSSSSMLIPIPANYGGTKSTEFNNNLANAESLVTGLQNTGGSGAPVTSGVIPAPAATVINPSGGVTICLTDGNTPPSYYGIITIGGNASLSNNTSGNPLSVQLTEGTICP